MATWPIASLEELSKQGYLVRLNTSLLQQQALQKNQSWQHKLMKQQASFLVDYDLLFRRITHLLVAQGYDFSSLHPHQTLKKLLLLLDNNVYSDAELSHLVECRHNVKYGFMDKATPQAVAILADLGVGV